MANECHMVDMKWVLIKSQGATFSTRETEQCQSMHSGRTTTIFNFANRLRLLRSMIKFLQAFKVPVLFNFFCQKGDGGT